ncbi:hypothetical protein [Mycobacteroides abscessus]|uniref:hypothetical protein n=3 Tax=Mycobacteroides abscessus TaxID=36809 RepID=UPI001041C83C|nr:hypothetical protein [Mycobacteroides abscessus]
MMDVSYGFSQIESLDNRADWIAEGLEHMSRVPGLSVSDAEEVESLKSELAKLNALEGSARAATTLPMASAEGSIGEGFAREVPDNMRIGSAGASYPNPTRKGINAPGPDLDSAMREVNDGRAALAKRAEVVLDRYWPAEDTLHWVRARFCFAPAWAHPAPHQLELTDVPMDELLAEVKRRTATRPAPKSNPD